MSSISKMSIQGIRSFGPEDKDKGVIEFFAPLTLILGPNGTGKTTIIECLRYMTTGEMPPGSKIGGAFIHDPKIAHEREVKAQIRLQFRDVKGEVCVGQRSLVATQQVKNITMKTLDGLITRKLKDGTKASISKRCADMDREIVALLGVSKPVLDHVIFCHQEESNWPLSEGKALKQKFDDIFASTRYVKALEAIRNQRKAQGQTINEYKIEVKHLKQNKEKAALIRADLEDRETRYLASRENVEKINEKLQPIQEKLNLIESRVSDIYKLKTNIEKLKSEQKQMEKHAKELQDQIGEEFEGDTEDLRNTLRQFEGQVQEKEDLLEQNIMKQSGLDVKLEKLNDKKSTLLLEQGKLEQEAERHKGNIKKRDIQLRNIADKYDIPGFTSAIDDRKVEQFFSILNDKVKEKMDQAKERRSDYDEKITKLQKEVDKENKNKTTLETQQRMKQQQLQKNKEEIRKFNQELSRVAASGEKLKDIELDLKRAENSLKATESSVDLNSLKAEITELHTKKAEQVAKLKDIDSLMGRMTREATTRSEIDVFRKDKTGKEDQVRRLKAKNEDAVRQILGSFPEEGLSRKLESYILKQNKAVRECQRKLQTSRSKLATLEAEKKNFSDHLKVKENDLRNKQEKIETVCHSQSLDDEVEKINNSMKNEEKTKGSLVGMEYLYNKYTDKLRGNDPPCPLCSRPFTDNNEVQDLIDDLERRLTLVPERMEVCDQKLDRFKKKYEQMLLLGPVMEEISVLEKEVPRLKEKIREVSDIHDVTTMEIGELDDELEVLQSNEATAKDMQSDATMIDAHTRDIRDLTKKIEGLNKNLSGDDSGKSLIEVQHEREDIQDALETVNTKLDRKRQNQSEHSERLQHQKATVNELRAEKLKIESDLQQRVRLEDQKEQLENVNLVLDSEIEEAKEEVEPLQSKVRELESEKQKLVQSKERQWEKDKESINEVKDNKQCIEVIHDEVHRYLELKKDKQLEQKTRDRSKLEDVAKDIVTERENISDSIGNIRKDLDQQKTKQRELNDNLKLRDKRAEITVVKEQIQGYKDKLGDLDVDNLARERQDLQDRQGNMIKEKHQLEGRKQGLEDEIRKLKRELKDDMFKDADQKYRDQIIALRTTELASQDLDKYYRALDMAIMNYHNKKMSDINKIIRELWRNTYKGNDIETIEIRTDQEDKATTAGCDKRRTYQYRVVMLKGDIAIDMRGRCSAGQKVLCAIIIRLALAETFCLNCGVFALDEPTTNLDRENIESLAYALVEIIKSRSKQSNFQLICITHDEDFVELLGRSDYVEEFFKVRKDNFGCSQLVKSRVQDLHSR